MKAFAILMSGVLFGIGVTLSGMVNPMRVLNFLDVTGLFDPTLIFVMAFALLTALVGYRFVFRGRPWFAPAFVLPAATEVNAQLIAGAAVFGAGWGLSGFCPGPAIASLVFGHLESFIFTAAMAAGMLLARLTTGLWTNTSSPETSLEAG